MVQIDRRFWYGMLATLLAVALGTLPVTADVREPIASGSSRATPAAAAAGYASPEDAITEYLAGVAEADVERILRTTAADEVSENLRFDLAIDRLRSFTPFMQLAPAEYPFYADITRALRTSEVLNQVRLLTYSLLLLEPFDGNMITGVDQVWAESFVIQVDPFRLDGLTVEDIRFSDATLANDERYLAAVAEQAATYGAAEMTERLVLIAFEGNLYDIGFTLLRYGENWKIMSQAAQLAGTDASGIPRRTTLEDYELQTQGA